MIGLVKGKPLAGYPRWFRFKMWLERHTGFPRMPRRSATYGPRKGWFRRK
jgi:hypothetical protein